MFVLTINEIISGVKAKSFFLPIIILFNHISTEEENTDRPGNRKNLILLTETRGKKTKLGRFSSAEKKRKKRAKFNSSFLPVGGWNVLWTDSVGRNRVLWLPWQRRPESGAAWHLLQSPHWLKIIANVVLICLTTSPGTKQQDVFILV